MLGLVLTPQEERQERLRSEWNCGALEDRIDAMQRDYEKLQRRYDDLQAKHTEVLDAIRAYCDETDIEYEGKLSAALRQLVWNEEDTEALIAMEGYDAS